jgi:sec-independent protein translocase protein TatA
MPFGLQPIHVVVVVIVALIVFGPKRLPEVGRWVGRTLSGLQQSAHEMTFAMREEAIKGTQAGQGSIVPQTKEPDPTIANPASSQSIPVITKFCTKCGTPNPSDALFCNKCGNAFAA